MITTMVEVIAAETGTYDLAEWEVNLDGRSVTVTPDRVVIAPDGTVHVQRIRTGRKTKSEPDHRIYALLRRGAQARYRGRKISIETFYLATRETVPVPPRKDDQLLAEYRDAITEIERGEFTPAPEDARRCPNCQCYFTAISFRASPDHFRNFLPAIAHLLNGPTSRLRKGKTR
jgi:DNA helicase II / ATP-dependent DNA helicase PcrA